MYDGVFLLLNTVPLFELGLYLWKGEPATCGFHEATDTGSNPAQTREVHPQVRISKMERCITGASFLLYAGAVLLRLRTGSIARDKIIPKNPFPKERC